MSLYVKTIPPENLPRGQKQVILLHGFCEDHTIWDHVLPAFTDCTLHLVDLPGFGRSEMALPENMTIDWVAEYIYSQLIDSRQLQPVVIGHSLGGYVALALAEKYPDELSGICLFHSTCFADSPEKRDTRNKVISFVEANGVTSYTSQFVPGLFHSLFRRQHATEVQKVVDLAGTTPLKTLTGYTAAMRDRPDRTGALAAFKGKKLIIAGDKDGAVPLEQSLKMSELVGEDSFVVLKATAHMGMFERPGQSREILASWA